MANFVWPEGCTPLANSENDKFVKAPDSAQTKEIREDIASVKRSRVVLRRNMQPKSIDAIAQWDSAVQTIRGMFPPTVPGTIAHGRSSMPDFNMAIAADGVFQFAPRHILEQSGSLRRADFVARNTDIRASSYVLYTQIDFNRRVGTVTLTYRDARVAVRSIDRTDWLSCDNLRIDAAGHIPYWG